MDSCPFLPGGVVPWSLPSPPPPLLPSRVGLHPSGSHRPLKKNNLHGFLNCLSKPKPEPQSSTQTALQNHRGRGAERNRVLRALGSKEEKGLSSPPLQRSGRFSTHGHQVLLVEGPAVPPRLYLRTGEKARFFPSISYYWTPELLPKPTVHGGVAQNHREG